MSSSNNDFGRFQEERKRESFFKVLQRVDISSENMRALPYDFVRNFSDDEVSRKMKIKAQWGSSWEIEISKNPRFYYMKKSGWEKFVKDNALGDNEFVTFTHKRKMHFAVNIFKQNGKEMLLPPQSRTFLASSSRVKTEQGEVMVSSEMSDPGQRTPGESNGEGKNKRKLNFEKKKAEESKSSKRTEKVAGASSSSVKEFTSPSSFTSHTSERVPTSAVNDHMPKEKTNVKIHHPDGKKSWIVGYLAVDDYNSYFCRGWPKLVKEYPIALGGKCKFTVIKPDELILQIESAGASSSSSVKEFSITIPPKNYLKYLRIPNSATRNHMPEKKTEFKIYHPEGEKSWIVGYIPTASYSSFCRGWIRVVKEYPIAAGDKCKFTFINPEELVLVVS